MINREDYEVLDGFYPDLHKMIVNQAISNLTLDMRDKLIEILKRNGRYNGICTKCNSSLLRIVTEAAHLRNENKKYYEVLNNGEEKENGKGYDGNKNKQRRSTRKVSKSAKEES